jgi:hypothetical protein
MEGARPPVRVPLEFLKAGMRLARPITDAQGRLVASNGTLLSDSVVRLLRQAAIQSVLVIATKDLAPWEFVRPVDEDVSDLWRRIARERVDPALADIRSAVERHLRARAAQYEQEDAAAAARDAAAERGR